MKKLLSVVLMLFAMSALATTYGGSAGTKTGVYNLVDNQVSAGKYPAAVGDAVKTNISMLPDTLQSSFCFTVNNTGGFSITAEFCSPKNKPQQEWNVTGTNTTVTGLQTAIASYVSGTYPQSEADVLNNLLSAVNQSASSYSFSATSVQSTNKFTASVLAQ